MGDGAQTQNLELCKMGPAFLDTFERVAIGAGWARATWAMQFTPYLLGEAQAAYMVE